MIGPSANAALTGLDQRQAQIGGIEPETGQGARNATVGRDDKGGCGMRVAVLVAVVDGFKSECSCQCRDIAGISARDVGGVAQRFEADLRLLHLLRVLRGILRVEAHDVQIEVLTGTQAGLPERIGDGADHRAAQRIAGETCEDPHAWPAGNPLPDRPCDAVFVPQADAQR
ncbi:hypothetical protein [Bradyrhizobium elkanii]|uniref:hypothetical protein n=1 Tax=Bradyrhizobium elkanii TaxID=29448 RepID=UPI0005719378|nr:hypothetical protein [Bradyrhizobium elkanii]WLA85766.1 hypothetical protein QNJ99_17055 [Bradyrhizobium elkanii]